MRSCLDHARTLAPSYTTWPRLCSLGDRMALADTLLRGVTRESLKAILISNGAPQAAARGVTAAARSPELEAARRRLR